ncbi:MAG: polysaccharide biosynthesis tyrosine autokinase, partial [Deferribacteres bacterium]|nr:polysaccharide biosynthesis tyrosine autokinase [Deferribacteres bacterium]
MPQYELSLRDYIRIFQRRKFVIITTFLLVSVGSVLLSPKPSPIYKASTTVKIEERRTVSGLLSEWVTYNPGDKMASQAMIIKGFPIMKKVALRLKMINDDMPVTEIHRVVSGLQNSIDTERIERTNIIKITASASDPQRAKDLAENVASVYIEENLLEKTRQARNARRFIEEQLALLEVRLEKAEDRLWKFKEQMVDETAAIDKAERTDETDDMKELEPLREKLRELNFKLSAFMQRYTDRHPRIVRLKRQISELELVLEERLKESYSQQAEGRRESMARQEKKAADLKTLRKSLSEQKLTYARLARDVEVNKKLYMMFKEKLEEARINEAQKVGDVSIVDPPVMPSSPVNTRGKLNLLIGGMMGLLLGIVLAFIFEALDTSIGTIEDVENLVKLPVLGVIPSARGNLKKWKVKFRKNISPVMRREAEEAYIRLIVHHQPRSVVAEACRNIRTNLKLGPSRRTILVTSSGPHEGKSTLLTNLGLAVAQTGAKTLLASCDLRRPSIARTFGIKREPGLTELVAGTARMEEALRNIEEAVPRDTASGGTAMISGIKNLWVLPSGHLPANPAEILESGRWWELIEELKKEFDFIFFDSPPVLPVTDASLLASRLDVVVLCYEIGKISREGLLRAKVQLESVGANIAGVV